MTVFSKKLYVIYEDVQGCGMGDWTIKEPQTEQQLKEYFSDLYCGERDLTQEEEKEVLENNSLDDWQDFYEVRICTYAEYLAIELIKAIEKNIDNKGFLNTQHIACELEALNKQLVEI